jgi:hypothetical protein
VRLIVRHQTWRDLDADTDALSWCDIGLGEAGLAALGEVLVLARSGALWRPGETGGILCPTWHCGGDRQFLDQWVAKACAVPVELVVAIE